MHDFYSEGDYWWPDPENPDGPYIRKDGLSNPDNFKEQRRAMIRMNRIVGAMTSAYMLTGEQKYADKAMEHLKAWFVDSTTRMNPDLQYAQAILGRFTGRGIGIIDALHLVEVARSAYILQNNKFVSQEDIDSIKIWFSDLLYWLNNHEYGKAEKIHPNNHGTCWSLQAAAYAQLTGNDSVVAFCLNRYKNVLLPDQMDTDGSFPLEMGRTKPYGYSLFNMDAMSLLVQILSETASSDLWRFELADGRSIKKGAEFLYPYVIDKSSWPLAPDVAFWDYWPVSQAFLVLGANAYENRDYLKTWLSLDHDPESEEIQRNLVMRYPVLWLYPIRE